MDKNKYLLRIPIFIVGLFFMALGVALSIKADLGVSPVSCIPYVGSLRWTQLSIGSLTVVMNVLIMIMQMCLLRRNYKLFQLIQFPAVSIFGLFINWNLWLVQALHPTNYFVQAIYCLLGCVGLAIGIFMIVKTNITYLPGEGLAMAIHDTFDIEFGKAKIGVDSTMVIIGLVGSWLFFHEIRGLREGTIVAALLVGFLIKFINKYVHMLDHLTPSAPEVAIEEVLADAQSQSPRQDTRFPHLVITISREYGSGGHELGQALADRFGIAFYDSELIDLSIKAGGYSPEYIQANEQKLTHTLLFELYEQNYAYVKKNHPLDALFLVQSKIIRQLSQQGPCVIVGRCANFILQENPNQFSLFVHADYEYRRKKIAQDCHLDHEVSVRALEKRDRQREEYTLHYTRQVWNDATNYDLTIDSSKYTTQQAVELIYQAVTARQANKR